MYAFNYYSKQVVAIIVSLCFFCFAGELFPNGYKRIMDATTMNSIQMDLVMKMRAPAEIDWRKVQDDIFHDVNGLSLADVICYIDSDTTVSIGLAKGNTGSYNQNELFGEQRVWVLVLSKLDFQDKNKGKESLQKTSGDSNNAPDSISIEVRHDVLSYKPGFRASSMGGFLGAVAQFITGKGAGIGANQGSNETKDSLVNLIVRQYFTKNPATGSRDTIYYGMAGFPLSTNTSNRIAITPKKNGKPLLYINKNFANYDPSRVNASIGIGMSLSPWPHWPRHWSSKDSLYPDNDVNLYLFGLFYLLRPRYPTASEDCRTFWNSNLSIVAGANISSTIFNNIILGFRKGLWDDFGIVLGVNLRRTEPKMKGMERIPFIGIDKGLF